MGIGDDLFACHLGHASFRRFARGGLCFKFALEEIIFRLFRWN